jgi:hypothetical protein
MVLKREFKTKFAAERMILIMCQGLFFRFQTPAMRQTFTQLVVLSTILLMTTYSRAQCSGFPATVAESDCSSGSSIPSNNANISLGSSFAFCGTSSSSTSFSNVNLDGGTLAICGNATISGNYNRGTIIVACGATLTFSNLTMNNNVKIVNYGRVIVNGNMEFQNANNCFYNESTTSRLDVSGTMTFPQNNGQNGYLKNNGYISIGNTFDAKNGANVCLGPNSRIETQNFNYGNSCGSQNNRFTYNGSTGTAIIRYTGSATIYGTVTAASQLRINKGSSATQTMNCSGSWGSATVATNSPAIVAPGGQSCAPTSTNCFQALPVELIGFEAIAVGSRVDLFWTTASELHNDYFLLERSPDAQTWESVGTIPGIGTSSQKQDYGYSDLAPLRGLSYYRLTQVDTDGKHTISDMRSVVVRPEESFVLYPNPAMEAISLLPAPNVHFENIQLMDAAGRFVQDIPVSDDVQMIDVSSLSRGVYMISVLLLDGQVQQSRFILQ